jgi:rhamnose utilization protein RhaD (predicted bifunctional aldolase and dehydrogenase)
MNLDEIIDLSRYYGSNPDYVLAGGGNTSVKDETTLAVKGSGVSLAEIGPGGFVLMDRRRLGEIWEKTYPADPEEREKAALADLMAARRPGEEQKRPSVETLLHDLLPFRLVVHTHPALVNGLTCAKEGEKWAAELFGGEALWIPITNPGYVLALGVKKALEGHRARRGKDAEIIFLQNHGVFVGSGSADGIRERYRRIMDTLAGKISRRPDLSALPAPALAGEIVRALEGLGKEAGGAGGWKAAFLPAGESRGLVKDRAAFYPVSSAYSPDHIVYAGSDPLFVETRGGAAETVIADLRAAWEEFRRKFNRIPRIIAVQNTGVFALGASDKALSYSLELFTDAIKVAACTVPFGGPLFMTREYIDFINNWEVERYRSSISVKEQNP